MLRYWEVSRLYPSVAGSSPFPSPCSPVTRFKQLVLLSLLLMLTPGGFAGSQVSILGSRSFPAHTSAEASAGDAQRGVNYARGRWQ